MYRVIFFNSFHGQVMFIPKQQQEKKCSVLKGDEHGLLGEIPANNLMD